MSGGAAGGGRHSRRLAEHPSPSCKLPGLAARPLPSCAGTTGQQPGVLCPASPSRAPGRARSLLGEAPRCWQGAAGLRQPPRAPVVSGVNALEGSQGAQRAAKGAALGSFLQNPPRCAFPGTTPIPAAPHPPCAWASVPALSRGEPARLNWIQTRGRAQPRLLRPGLFWLPALSAAKNAAGRLCRAACQAGALRGCGCAARGADKAEEERGRGAPGGERGPCSGEPGRRGRCSF